MTTDVAGLLEAATALRGTLSQLRLDRALPGADAAAQDAEAMLRQLDDHVLPRLSHLEAPALVVIGGSTGSGKSLLTNSLVGATVTQPGYLRPTTTSPVLVHAPADAAWFRGRHVLPTLARVLDGEAHGHAEMRLVTTSALPTGVALLDSPDIDSVSVQNRTLAAELLAAADLWIFVTTAARYADAIPWEFLGAAQRRGTPLVIVLNRVPPAGSAPLTEHLSQMLAEQQLADTPVVAVAEQDHGDARLPADAVQSVRGWLDRLGSDRELRSAAIQRSLQGSMGDLAHRAGVVADAVDRQAAAVDRLREDVREAYADALRQVRADLESGTLLRGEVLARWEELLGTGELFRQLRTGLGRVRDRVTGLLTGRRRAQAEFTDAVETTLQTLIRTRGDAAAAEVVARWQARPGGEQLLADEAAGDERTLARSSADLNAAAGAAVRAWQGELLDLVREVGGNRKTTARVLSLGVNGSAAVVMVLVFAHTGGLTGAEAVVAGGAGAVGHTVLEAVLGDQTIRRLAIQARESLERKVADLYADEAARYEAVLAVVDVDAQTPAALRRAAAVLSTAAPGGAR
jgi:energy-coupling factor transporter ATP-binding protein EcfA2